ncbi:MAG: immunoglobulin domain-containing protein [Bacteroidota bacterium]|nr:immunoglobulin domain-containing protein [Bacteroidota bacterium]
MSTSTIANAVYSWTGPNSFISSFQNPVINNASPSNSGYYYLQIQNTNCTSPVGSVYITVINPSITGISGSQTVCEGTYASFVIANPDSGAVFSWSGPNNFFAYGDSIVFFPADTLHSGIYSVTETLGGCMGIADTVSLNVLAAPLPATVYSNSPLCEHDTLFLSADSLPGNAGYLWNGSTNGFTSTQQYPFIPDVNSTHTDDYMLWTVGTNGCYSTVPTWVSVTVNPLPQTSLGPDTTICSTMSITLQATGSFVSYVWQDNSTNNTFLADLTQLYWVAVTDING